MEVFICVIIQVGFASISAFPTNSEEDIAGRTFGVFSAQVRDSSSYPLVLDPLRINKLTCGSLLTLLDYSTPALTVSADACLILGLIVASLGALPRLLAPKETSFEGGALGAVDAFRQGFVDVGQGVFDNKVAPLRIPVENLLNSNEAKIEALHQKFKSPFQKRKMQMIKRSQNRSRKVNLVDISREELKTFNELPKVAQENILDEAVLTLDKVFRTHAGYKK